MSERVICGEVLNIEEIDSELVRESDRRLISWYLDLVLRIEAGVAVNARGCATRTLIRHKIVVGHSGHHLKLSVYGKSLLGEVKQNS